MRVGKSPSETNVGDRASPPRNASLRLKLAYSGWWASVWDDTTAQAAEEIGLSDFPETCPWDTNEILNQEWFPE